MRLIAGKLNDEEAAEMVQNMQLAASEVDSVLVQLLSTWAERGRDGSPRSQVGLLVACLTRRGTLCNQDEFKTVLQANKS